MKKNMFLSALLGTMFIMAANGGEYENALARLQRAYTSGNEEEIEMAQVILASLGDQSHRLQPSRSDAEQERLTQELLDRELALRLQKQLEEERLTQEFLAREEAARIAEAQDIQAQNDELAQEFLSQDFLRGLQLQDENSRMTVADRTFIRNLAQQALAFDNADVHAFNAAIVRPNLAQLLAIGDRYFAPKEDIPMAEIFREMRVHATRDGALERLNPAIDMLAGHLAQNEIDAETGIHVPRLLSRIWNLAVRHPNHRFAEQVGETERNSVGMIIHFSMPEGLATEGGCFPGYAGRFFRDYLALMTASMGRGDV